MCLEGKVRKRIAVCATSITPLRELTCHMGSHSITCHPAEVIFPPLPQPIKAGTRFSDPRGMQGWVDLEVYCPALFFLLHFPGLTRSWKFTKKMQDFPRGVEILFPYHSRTSANVRTSHILWLYNRSSSIMRCDISSCCKRACSMPLSPSILCSDCCAEWMVTQGRQTVVAGVCWLDVVPPFYSNSVPININLKLVTNDACILQQLWSFYQRTILI